VKEEQRRQPTAPSRNPNELKLGAAYGDAWESSFG
jgi:hypothetical protein